MKMKITVYGEDDEGGFGEDVEVPAKWEICDRCRGNGTHVNPSIDGNGITASEWAEWDDDEHEGYMDGHYDVPCEEGCYDGKVMVPDIDACPEELKKRIVEWEEQEAYNARVDAEDRRYQRMESGEW